MRRSTRQGLTLIELLAASAISLLILAAVYQTMQQSRMVLRTGRDFAQQSGVVHRVHLLLADCVMQRKLPDRLDLFDQPQVPRDLTLKKSLERWQADVERIEWHRKQRATQPAFVGLDESLLLVVPCDSIFEPSLTLGEKAFWIGCGKPKLELLPDAWRIPAGEMPKQPDSTWEGLWIATFRQPLLQSAGMQRWRFDKLRLISSDIASMHLRYHDGQQWRTSWSGVVDQLPVAIEIHCQSKLAGSSADGGPLVLDLSTGGVL
jgi:prepilin-type N-terminal cleavage/methylation domain-containing protein